MKKRLDGRTALITGASSGIGMETALLFAKEGADVGLLARRKKELSMIASQCRAFGVQAIELVADITDKKQVDSAVKAFFAVSKRIDILVNNAGYGRYGSFREMAIDEWDRMLNVNVRGTVLVTQAVLHSMIAAKEGHIVNMSSIHGIHTAANASAYCASKFALTGLSRALSKELWEEGIRVSTICPGGVLTPFLGVAVEDKNPNFLDPKEVASLVVDVVTAPGRALIQDVVILPRKKPYFDQEIS